MGTSGPYTPSPKWSGVKTDVTNALGGGAVDGGEAHDLVSGFVRELCDQEEEGFGSLPSEFGHISGDKAKEKLAELLKHFPAAAPPRNTGQRGSSDGDSRGGGGGTGSGGGARAPSTGQRTGGGRRVGGKTLGGGAVRPTAQKLATFISQIPKVGLRQALINAGVSDVDKLPPEQIALAIADVLATDASLLIETELRAALTTELEEICEQPESIEAAEQKLADSAIDLQTVIQKLFENYIIERFKTFFCEHEGLIHGYEAADKILDSARDFVAAEMDLEREARMDLTSVDWTGSEGAKIVDGILEKTIAVYTD